MTKHADDEVSVVADVRLTHPDRVLFPEQGASKRTIAEYYQRICTRMLPFVDKRPLTLVRCPDGRDGQCFYQKHANASVPDAVGRIDIEEQSGETREYMLVDSVQGLVATAQVGALELHVWGARSDRLDRPERIVFDLDPDENLEFMQVREAAFELRDLLASAELKSYPLLTGGKGIHVVVPIRRTRTWSEAKQFSRGLANGLADIAPQKYVAKASKAARAGRVYIDWLRNERGATAVAPYSLRARIGAPIAVPVNWDEVASFRSARAFTLNNIESRLSDAGVRAWHDYFSVRQSITRAHLGLFGSGNN
jgi:bifunctional non-homologous end joining protein LigD